ncbi:MAG: hypothetical protein HFJ50_06475 [Clostridia bacterium]|jgi:hypothetical protein|nr:hypothetical protein [Clostridia bacterium]
MLIVSQDKRSIVNLEQVAIININRSDLREIEAFFDCNEDNQNSILLGKYATEERAKEVLQEIINCYLGEAMVECSGYICYEMPEN